jgi:hypothetical protein
VIRKYRTVRSVASRIARVAARSIQGLVDGEVEQETALTDRMLGAIVESLEDFTRDGIHWRAKTLTDHGNKAQEKEFGADFMGVLRVSVPGFKIEKGFLAQAKLLRRNKVDDEARLKAQCARMLQFTPDAFVFLYSKTGVRIVPALAVASATVGSEHLYSRSVQRFFEDHLECFIGDSGIAAATPSGLELIRSASLVRRTLILEGASSTPQLLVARRR